MAHQWLIFVILQIFASEAYVNHEIMYIPACAPAPIKYEEICSNYCKNCQIQSGTVDYQAEQSVPHQYSDNSYDFQSKNYENPHNEKKNVQYSFQYAVNDKKTNDFKRHHEERHGDVVKGEYSLVEADGNIRTVKYYADWKTGFHAQVFNSKHN